MTISGTLPPRIPSLDPPDPRAGKRLLRRLVWAPAESAATRNFRRTHEKPDARLPVVSCSPSFAAEFFFASIHLAGQEEGGSGKILHLQPCSEPAGRSSEGTPQQARGSPIMMDPGTGDRGPGTGTGSRIAGGNGGAAVR